jgi:hypothetical protein
MLLTNSPVRVMGLQVDSLFNISYPDLLFNIKNELTGNTSDQKFTIREHNGLLAPTDEAIDGIFEREFAFMG